MLLCKSVESFPRCLATDKSLWKGTVQVDDKPEGSAKFVVRECLNDETREFIIWKACESEAPVNSVPNMKLYPFGEYDTYFEDPTAMRQLWRWYRSADEKNDAEAQ